MMPAIPHRKILRRFDGIALAALAAASGMALFLAGAAWATARASASPTTVSVALGSRQFVVPKELLSPLAAADAGRLDLVVPLPPGSGPSPLDDVVLVGIEVLDPGAASDVSRDIVHSRFVTGEVWTNPGGLQLRRFQPGSPFEGEELYVTTGGTDRFAARCPRLSVPTAVPGLCIADTVENGLAVVISFSRNRLADWKTVREAVRRTLTRIEPAAG